jgi:hypothetical protein
VPHFQNQSPTKRIRSRSKVEKIARQIYQINRTNASVRARVRSAGRINRSNGSNSNWIPLSKLMKINHGIRQPPGFEQGNDMICLLKKGLYGSRQGARLWQFKAIDIFVKFGFQRLHSDALLM